MDVETRLKEHQGKQFSDWDIDLKRLDPKVPLQFIYTDIDEPGTVTIKVTYVPS